MTDDTPGTPLTPEEEAAQGWALIDTWFLRWHDRTCGTHTFKGNRPVCDCGLQDALDRERRERVDPDPRMTAVVKAATDLIEHGEWTAGQNAHWLQTMGEGKALYIALREAVEALDG